MAVATIGFYMPGFGPYGQGGAGNLLNAYASQLAPEGMPSWIWGQGTPAAFQPWTTVNKGSLYSEVNAAGIIPSNCEQTPSFDRRCARRAILAT